ncbi:MAG: peptidase [Thermoplasmata archaeon]|nr:MAG: peptidase [Thermoplasmata archaeon]
MYLYLYNSANIDITSISEGIEKTFPVKVAYKGYKEVPLEAFHAERKQWYAPVLLSLLIEKPSIWIVDVDIYTNGMNFIFGLAGGGKAIVSSYRLGSIGMVGKEVTHEIGHIFGLPHCKNRCVMQFSNSLIEAIEKPSWLCNACKKKLEHKINI